MRSLLFVLGLSLCAVHPPVAAAADPPMTRPGGTITLNAPGAIHSMDGTNKVYSGISIQGGTIQGLSDDPYGTPTLLLPAGAAIYPGFIDTHSHAFSLLMAATKSKSGKPYWTSLANVNVMLQQNFQPVTTQQQVIDLLKNAPVNEAGWVLGWNYEPSRLTCGTTYGFLCTNNFENQSQQTALEQLEAIRKDVPMLVTSESGHIVYVNKLALAKLDICNASPNATDDCYMPTINPAIETRLASTGQLNEDVALHAIGFVEGVLKKHYGSGFMEEQIAAALAMYSQLGYTTVQEGAANEGLILTYMKTAYDGAKAKTPKYLPATMAFLQYDDTTPANFGSTAKSAKKLQSQLTRDGYDMFIAGLKTYSDGSNQGYTGDMQLPTEYLNLAPPYTNPLIYPQPYDGLPDYDACALVSAAQEAHRSRFPLWVHTNGDQAQANVVGALITGHDENLRDVIVHFTMPTRDQVAAAARNKIGATFLINDFYYFYQPLCEQILGPSARSANLYPTVWAEWEGMTYSLHSDVSVTPPTPWFAMWVASTRSFQPVGPNPISPSCKEAALNHRITRLNALRAYTSMAAWLYNRDTSTAGRPGIGSLQKDYAGDLVVLSADPMNDNVDLSQIYVLYTIHNGNIVYPANGGPTPPPATYVPPWPN